MMAEESKHPEWMGKNRGLTPEEVMQFLAGPVVARVATIDEEGLPYITPVWQEWDGEALWIIPRERSAWVQHIKKNPNVAISCAMDSGTYTRVLMRGKAEIASGPEPMQGKCLEIANRMAVRFLGERGPEYLVPTYDRPRYLIKFVPTQIITWEGVEWAAKYTAKT
jgi:nitroimidazol reductase NimA-like FMN-containing flavoprotein (pyridoxamine 5'-phosphate oxidase superfamily)